MVYLEIQCITFKMEKSFIAHPWIQRSVVGLEEYSAHDWRAATSGTARSSYLARVGPVTTSTWSTAAAPDWPRSPDAINWQNTQHDIYLCLLLSVETLRHGMWYSIKTIRRTTITIRKMIDEVTNNILFKALNSTNFNFHKGREKIWFVVLLNACHEKIVFHLVLYGLLSYPCIFRVDI